MGGEEEEEKAEREHVTEVSIKPREWGGGPRRPELEKRNGTMSRPCFCLSSWKEENFPLTG